MKYIFLLFFLFACNSGKSSDKAKKMQVQKNKHTIHKRIPAQNRSIINELNNQNVEETLKKIQMLEKDEMIQEQERYKKPTSSLRYADAEKTQKVKNEQSQNYQSKRVIEEDFILSSKKSEPQKQEPVPAPQTLQPPKSEILEISGMQNKSRSYNAVQEESSFFILSTSPSYIGEDLDKARLILSQFGEVRIQKVGDMFALKVYSKKPLKTRAEANEMLKEVVRYPFFDVYIEESRKD